MSVSLNASLCVPVFTNLIFVISPSRVPLICGCENLTWKLVNVYVPLKAITDPSDASDITPLLIVVSMAKMSAKLWHLEAKMQPFDYGPFSFSQPHSHIVP